MRSLSDVLIKKREEKGLSVPQVAYETNISKKYIEALEEEHFDVFPAEAYLLGFLRNYSDFLGIDYDYILGEYKNCLLREEPTPLSELIGKRKRFEFRSWMIIVPLIILFGIFVVPIVTKGVVTQIDKRKEALRLAGEDKSQKFIIDDDFSGKQVRIGDSLTLTIEETDLVLLIREINSHIILTQTFKGKEKVLNLKLGNEVVSEIEDNNKKYIITVLLKDIGGFSDNSAIIKVKREIRDLVNFGNDNEQSATSSANQEAPKVIMVKKRSSEVYSLNIRFEGDILFRYQLKGKALKENFYQKNSVLNLDVTRSIQIWTSNAGLTKLKLNGEIIVLGRTGQVHVFTLRWIFNKEKDEYRLEYAKAY